LVITDINTDVVTRLAPQTPLANPADDSNNTYQVEVTATALVDPAFKYNMPFFGAAPGLTAPMVITMIDRQYAENPQGLNQ
jgi:hypothetical protein